MKTINFVAGITLSLLASHFEGRGAVVITVQEVGNDVVASASGELNTTSLTDGGIAGGTSGNIFGSQSQVYVGPTTQVDFFTGLAGPFGWGTGAISLASTSSGSFVGIWGAGQTLYLPHGYVSGSAISASSTFSGKSIASLGITPGSYTYSWGSGANIDHVTISVVAVPEIPETLAVAGGMCLITAWLNRRHASRRTSSVSEISGKSLGP